jgi:hypothetical protein
MGGSVLHSQEKKAILLGMGNKFLYVYVLITQEQKLYMYMSHRSSCLIISCFLLLSLRVLLFLLPLFEKSLHLGTPDVFAAFEVFVL